MDKDTAAHLEVALERLLKPRGRKDAARLLRAVVLGLELAADLLDKFDAKIGKRVGHEKPHEKTPG